MRKYTHLLSHAPIVCVVQFLQTHSHTHSTLTHVRMSPLVNKHTPSHTRRSIHTNAHNYTPMHLSCVSFMFYWHILVHFRRLRVSGVDVWVRSSSFRSIKAHHLSLLIYMLVRNTGMWLVTLQCLSVVSYPKISSWVWLGHNICM